MPVYMVERDLPGVKMEQLAAAQDDNAGRIDRRSPVHSVNFRSRAEQMYVFV